MNRMYDRTVEPIPEPTTTGLRNRIENLLGITGLKMAKYRVSWTEAIFSPFRLVWRPHLLMILIFEVCAYNSECTLIWLRFIDSLRDLISGHAFRLWNWDQREHLDSELMRCFIPCL